MRKLIWIFISFLFFVNLLKAQEHSFGTFSTGTQSGGTVYNKSLDVTGLTADYLFYSVTASFSASGSSAAYSNEIVMGLNNGGVTSYKDNSEAQTGAAGNSDPTTLQWYGMMRNPYPGGDNLTISFDDINSGYEYILSDVAVVIYPAPTPEKSFTTFSTGTQSGGTVYNKSLDVTGLTADYLFYSVTASFSASGSSAAYSNEIVMGLNNGGVTSYKDNSEAQTGAAGNSDPTTLQWYGMMRNPYPGGDNLTISFDDINSGYEYILSDVAVVIYPAPSTIPTPVELTSFTASIVEEGVELNWETATEVNNYGFEIERSSFQTDGTTPVRTEWQTIAFIEGHGNSNSPKSYEYIDNLDLSLDPSLSLEYRLKQIDTDGGYEYYSTTAKVDIEITDVNDNDGLPKEFKLEQNYPNPFNPITIINYEIPNVETLHATSTNVQLKIFDVLGKEIATLVNKQQTAGSYSVNFDARNLPSGMYIYKLQAGEFTDSKKLILMK